MTRIAGSISWLTFHFPWNRQKPVDNSSDAKPESRSPALLARQPQCVGRGVAIGVPTAVLCQEGLSCP